MTRYFLPLISITFASFLKHNIFVHGMANLGLINTNEFRSALDFETLLPFKDNDDPLLVAVFFKTLGTKDNW